MPLSTPACLCSDPACYDHEAASQVVCGLRRSGAWVCVYCGAPAVNLAGPVAVVRHSVGLWAGRVAFECRLGALSAYAPVRWWAALRR